MRKKRSLLLRAEVYDHSTTTGSIFFVGEVEADETLPERPSWAFSVKNPDEATELRQKIDSAMDELFQEIKNRMSRIEADIIVPTLARYGNFTPQQVETHQQKVKKSTYKKRGGSQSEVAPNDRQSLACLYAELLPKWREAKQDLRDLKKDLTKVRRLHPDLPEKLLGHLSESAPSDLALYNAAWVLQLTENLNLTTLQGLSTLRSYLPKKKHSKSK